MTKEEFFGKFKSLYLWGNLAAMVVVVILLFFCLKWWMSSYTHHGQKVEVPNVLAKDYKAAEEMLSEKGLQIKNVGTTYVEDMPGGYIVVQTPAAGAEVKEGRIIYVTVNSLTVPREKIPNIIDNCSYREAQAKLIALEFQLTEPRMVDGPRDWVMGIQSNGRNLHNGDSVAKKSLLTLVIGNGSLDTGGDDMEELPDLPAEEMEEVEEDTPTEDNVDTFLEVFE